MNICCCCGRNTKSCPFTRLSFNVKPNATTARRKAGNCSTFRTLASPGERKRKLSSPVGGLRNPLWLRILLWYKMVFCYHWRKDRKISLTRELSHPQGRFWLQWEEDSNTEKEPLLRPRTQGPIKTKAGQGEQRTFPATTPTCLTPKQTTAVCIWRAIVYKDTQAVMQLCRACQRLIVKHKPWENPRHSRPNIKPKVAAVQEMWSFLFTESNHHNNKTKTQLTYWR